MGHHYTIFDRHKMPLSEDGHSWKKKTSDIKDIYDFKEVLGTHDKERIASSRHQA